jgi:tetratricopeptide (TPR) repeat protein
MRYLPLLCLFALSTLGEACLWDSDTIASEKARFPGVEEVIFGNFPRHSKEFYEWRKTVSKAALASDPTDLALYDDLAVAQHKLGDHEGAIATMKKKDAIKPGLYETYSNTGTFYIYTGNLPAALEQINKALAVNPNAHFGREKYQKWLIEWVMEGMPDRARDRSDFYPGTGGFAGYVLEKQPADQRELTERLRNEAITAISGMMRFADFDNPLLQEAIGDFLAAGSPDKNATLHASLAYLHAARTKQGTLVGLNTKRDRALSKFEDGDKQQKLLSAGLKHRLAKGASLAATVRKDEIAWIAAGKDASAEFQKKYLQP